MDLARIARRDQRVDPEVAPTPRVPAPLPSATRTLPALPARTIAPGKGVSRAELRAELEFERAAAGEALARRLSESYAADARAVEFARLREIEGARLAGAAGVVGAIRDRFESYNAARAPLVARLAFLAGFPDPGPRTGVEADERDKEAASLRVRLAALDREFDAFIAGLQSEAEAELARRLAALREEIAATRRELEARAIREAREQIAEIAADLDLRLGGGEAVTLPAVPARSVTLPASGRLPQVNFAPVSPPDRRDERLRAELRIWSGLRRARVVPAAPGVRDATAEFEKWHQNR